MADGKDHVDQEDGDEYKAHECEDGDYTDHAEDDEYVACTKKSVIVFQLSQASADLHRAEHQAEKHEHDQDPAEVPLKEHNITIIPIQIPAYEMCVEVAYAVYRIDSSEPKVAKLVAFVDLRKGIDVDVAILYI